MKNESSRKSDCTCTYLYCVHLIKNRKNNTRKEQDIFSSTTIYIYIYGCLRVCRGSQNFFCRVCLIFNVSIIYVYISFIYFFLSRNAFK